MDWTGGGSDQVMAQGESVVALLGQIADSMKLVSTYLSEQSRTVGELNDKLQKQREIQREVAEAARQARQTVKAVGADMSAALASVVSGFTQARQAVNNFVSAASPEIAATLADSFGLLSGEIGLAFIPATMGAVQALQDAADWFHNLDAGTKDTLVSVTLWTVGIGGAVVMLTRAVAVVGQLWNVMRVGYGLLVTPWGAAVAGIAALAGAIGYLTGAFSSANSKAEEVNKQLDRMEAFRQKAESGGRLERRDLSILSAEEQQALAATGGNKQQQEAVLKAIQEKYKGQIAGTNESDIVQRQATLRKELEDLEGNALNVGRYRREALQRAGVRDEQLPSSINLRSGGNDLLYGALGQEKIEQLVRLLGQDAEIARGRLAFAQQGLAQGVPGIRGPMIHWPKEMQPHFTGLSQARRDFQIAAMKDPLEQARMEQARQAFVEAQKTAANTERTAGTLDRIAQIFSTGIFSR